MFVSAAIGRTTASRGAKRRIIRGVGYALSGSSAGGRGEQDVGLPEVALVGRMAKKLNLPRSQSFRQSLLIKPSDHGIGLPMKAAVADVR